MEITEPPNPDYSIRRRGQQKGVGAGLWFELGRRAQSVIALGKLHPSVGHLQTLAVFVRTTGSAHAASLFFTIFTRLLTSYRRISARVERLQQFYPL
jgi:hypothetical protein